RLSGIVAISSAIHSELIECGVPERKIARIPNGVDTDLFCPVIDSGSKNDIRCQLGLAGDPIIVFSGAVTPRKRPHLLLEALGILKSQGLEPRLVLAGPAKDKDYDAKMRALAAELG